MSGFNKLCRMLSFGLVVSAFPVMSAVFTPQEAEEGETVSFSWTWPVGFYSAGCSLSGIPGLNANNSSSSATNYTFKAGKSKVVAKLECFNSVHIGDGKAQVTKNFSETYEMKLKPTMTLAYPDNHPPGSGIGVVEGGAYTFSFSATNADTCEARYLPDMAWKTISTNFKDKFSYSPVPTGGAAIISAKCTNQSGTFQKDIRVPVVPKNQGPSVDVVIKNFLHGNYELRKTKLFWSTSNAKSCAIRQNNGQPFPVDTQGLVGFQVDVGHTYTLECSGNNGSKASKPLVVTDVTASDVVIDHFSSENYYSGTAALRWGTSYARTCELSGSNGYLLKNADNSGLATLRVPTGYTYTLKCDGFNSSVASRSLPVTSKATDPGDDSGCVPSCDFIPAFKSDEYATTDEFTPADKSSVLTLEQNGEKYKVIQRSEHLHEVYRLNIQDGQYEFVQSIINPEPRKMMNQIIIDTQ